MSDEPVKPPRVRLRRPDRSQVEMVVRCPDDLIPAGHPARVVWAFTGRVDLSAFAAPIRAVEGRPGRDATDPRLLFALWLYAYTRGVGSARELARLCRHHDAYRWLCGGVSVNHHTLGDFRTAHGAALDALFTRVIAALVDRGLVRVTRISQDGTRVRACAGAGSFRREGRLEKLLAEAKAHVDGLRRQLDDPSASAGLSAKRQAARERAARERLERVEAAAARMPELEARQEQSAQDAGDGERGRRIRAKEPRASTTDADARVMKMPDGGFRPAVNVQLAVDTDSRAIVGVDVTDEGSDSAGLSGPMREQVERRSGGRKVEQHLLDGGYLKLDDIGRAHEAGVELFVPPKPARNAANRGRELEPKRGDSAAVLAWKARMAGEEGKEIYKRRASTSETVNADLKGHRGLVQLTVRGLAKARCVALWAALAYNVMHFAHALLLA
jgi:transposase